jgi:hypothetical protein
MELLSWTCTPDEPPSITIPVGKFPLIRFCVIDAPETPLSCKAGPGPGPKSA